MNLTLFEALLLIAFDDEKGSNVTSNTELAYGLAGSILMELALLEKIDVAENKLVIKNDSLIKNAVLDKVLTSIIKSEKKYSLESWISKIGARGSELQKIILDGLLLRGVLKKKEGRILWFFKTDKYPTNNPYLENELRHHLHEVVLYDKEPNVKDVMILSLIRAASLVKELFPQKELRKKAEFRIKEITDGQTFGKAVNNSIHSVQAATISATIGALVAVNTAVTINMN